MNDPVNPYSVTTETSAFQDGIPSSPVIPAGKGARFVNFIIDYFVQTAIGFVFGFTVVLIGGQAGLDFIEATPGLVIGIPILLAYYFFFEAATGRTLGKLITGTKVVNETGGKPSLGQIAGRSFCRIIPFEALSFLGSTGRGWHDSIPKTYVVSTR